MKKTVRRTRGPAQASLAGQFLIAMPGMRDERFARTVIFMCVHSAEQAMGIIVNRRADNISFPSLLKQLKLKGLPVAAERAPGFADTNIHFGGPVETGRGFVLHSPDYQASQGTLNVKGTVCLTTTVDILAAMARGDGPQRALLALGYAGWSGGQLEEEMRANGWLHCPADVDIVLDSAVERKYERALASLGVAEAHLVSEAGHA